MLTGFLYEKEAEAFESALQYFEWMGDGKVVAIDFVKVKGADRAVTQHIATLIKTSICPIIGVAHGLNMAEGVEILSSCALRLARDGASFLPTKEIRCSKGHLYPHRTYSAEEAQKIGFATPLRVAR